MIIKKLRVEHFGCFQTPFEVEFTKGLNIILGPNEAGKSTIFNAIEKSLFTPVRLKPTEYRTIMKRWEPLGSDSLSAVITFTIKGKKYELSKRWGVSSQAVLRLSDGSTVSDDSAISAMLSSILPAKPGTFKSVLMTYQSGLLKTVDELKNEHVDTLHTLGDILRAAFLETGGVSVEAFKARIEEQYSRYLSRWDLRDNGPEKGRGIENPWLKEVGELLAVYYKKEALRKQYEDALRFEERLDGIVRRLNECSTELADLSRFVRRNERMAKDALERRSFSATLQAGLMRIDHMKKANAEWPVIEEKIKQIEARMPAIIERHKALSSESEAASYARSESILREKHQRAKAWNDRLTEAKAILAGAKKITAMDVDFLRKAESAMERLQSKLTSVGLNVRIKAASDARIEIRKDLEAPSTIELKEGEIKDITAGGFLSVSHPGIEIETTAGKIDIKSVKAEHERQKQGLSDTLLTLGVASIDTAAAVSKEYERLTREAQNARTLLDKELGGESFEAIEMSVSALGEPRNLRPLEDIAVDLTNAVNERRNLGAELEALKKKLFDLTSEFGSMDKLFTSLGAIFKETADVEAKIALLTPLPEGVDSAESFVEAFEAKRLELAKMERLMSDLREERARVEGESPELTTEDLETARKEAEEEFDSIERKALAIMKIKTLSERLLENVDKNIYTELQSEIEKHVSAITGRRHEKVAMDGGMPKGFVLSDGRSLGYDSLSMGTADALSLALRLAMAEYFLKEADGFIMLDDPLVDMDPERQANASEVIQAYARNRQVVVFTCHPSHATALGGNLINLPSA